MKNYKNYFLTSESVTKGHPDKVADLISDSILDEYLRKDKNSRVAVETMLSNGKVTVAGQVSSNGQVDIEKVVRDTLKKVGYDVDYVITHCAPTSIQTLIGGESYRKDYLTDYFQKIYEKTKFKKWYFGHYHNNRQINEQFILLYEDIVELK